MPSCHGSEVAVAFEVIMSHLGYWKTVWNKSVLLENGLLCGLETAPSQYTGSWLPSLRTTGLHCPPAGVWHSHSLCFVQFSSCLKQEDKSCPIWTRSRYYFSNPSFIATIFFILSDVMRHICPVYVANNRTWFSFHQKSSSLEDCLVAHEIPMKAGQPGSESGGTKGG